VIEGVETLKRKKSFPKEQLLISLNGEVCENLSDKLGQEAMFNITKTSFKYGQYLFILHSAVLNTNVD